MARYKRQKIGWGILLLLLLVGLLGWGWWRSTRFAERTFTLYYTDPQAMFLIPLTQRATLPGRDEEALEHLLDALETPPAGLQPTLPPGTEAQVQTISNGVANVSLSLPARMGTGSERLVAGAVVRTAASLESVREVRLQLRDRRGNPLESQHLDLSAPLSPTDPGMENLYLDGGHEGLTVKLYYATPDGRYLVPLRRPLPPQYASQPIEGSFQLLVSGPPPELAGVLGSSVPTDPGITWGGTSQEAARIQWPQDMQAPSEQAMRAFALTLTEFTGIRQVSVTQADAQIAQATRPEAINPATASVYPGSQPGKTD